MTIITKPVSEKKVTKPQEKPLVVDDIRGGDFVEKGNLAEPAIDDVEAWLSPTVRRRVSTTTTVCVFITALLVMCIGIIGGVYLYRQFTQHQQMSKFRGWCGIPYGRDALHVIKNDRFSGQDRPVFKENPDAEWVSDMFKEEFELDLDTEAYEQIYVPDFEVARQARFIHDFKTNNTAIVDLLSKRCFVMPLDRNHILPPRSLFDLIRKMWMGYYDIDTNIVQRTMRPVKPPIEDLDSLGSYIAKNCADYNTYLLEEVYTPDLKKRSIEKKPAALNLVEFAGKNIIKFTILDEQEQQ